MFKELAPLLRHRAILLTVTHVQDNQFRVNVIPKKLNDGDNDALTTPVSITGTVEDLDAQLPATLVNFVSSHLELENTLARAKAEMDAAGKAAQAEARKKNKTAGTKPETSREAKTAEPESPAPRKVDSPKPQGLFDAAPEPFTATSEPNRTAEDDEAILAEIKEEETAEDFPPDEVNDEAA